MSETIVGYLVKEVREDLSNATFGPEAWVRAVIETLLGFALLVRIVRDSLSYALTQGEAPASTNWSLTLDPQLPAREREQYTRNADFNARMATALIFGGLVYGRWSLSFPLAAIVVANWLAIVGDPLAFVVYRLRLKHRKEET